MKCLYCGNELNPQTERCDACGGIVHEGLFYPNAVACFLDKPVWIGMGSIRRFDLVKLILLNGILFAIFLNALLFAGFEQKSIWFQYFVGPMLACYHILKSFFCARTHFLGSIRSAFYWLMVTLLLSGYLHSLVEPMLFYIVPLLLLFLDLLAVSFLLFRCATPGSFAVTVTLNLLIGLAMLAVIYFHPAFLFGRGATLHLFSGAFSLFLLINQWLIRMFFSREGRAKRKR